MKQVCGSMLPIAIPEKALWIDTKTIRDLGHIMNKDTLRDLELLSLKKED